MPENPLATLARVFGGVVLTQGTLGHQVLGQLLIMNTNEVAVAAAVAVVAGTAGERSAVGQIALRTVAPALAVRVLLNKQEERLKRTSRRLDERERELIRQRIRLHRKRWQMRNERARTASLGSVETASVPMGTAERAPGPGSLESAAASTPGFDAVAFLPAPPGAAVLTVSPAPSPEPAPRPVKKSASRKKAGKAQPSKQAPKAKVSRRSGKSSVPKPRRGGAKKR